MTFDESHSRTGKSRHNLAKPFFHDRRKIFREGTSTLRYYDVEIAILNACGVIGSSQKCDNLIKSISPSKKTESSQLDIIGSKQLYQSPCFWMKHENSELCTVLPWLKVPCIRSTPFKIILGCAAKAKNFFAYVAYFSGGFKHDASKNEKKCYI